MSQIREAGDCGGGGGANYVIDYLKVDEIGVFPCFILDAKVCQGQTESQIKVRIIIKTRYLAWYKINHISLSQMPSLEACVGVDSIVFSCVCMAGREQIHANKFL